MFFRKLNPEKKRLLLAVLITFCWTSAAALALAGWFCGDRFWSLMSISYFLSGAAMFGTFWKIPAPAVGPPAREPANPPAAR